MAKEAWYINEQEMDSFQVPIVQRRMESSFVVKGCAGSGKTVLALWKAREVIESELGSYYVVVYTKALRQFIQDGVEVAGLDESRVLHHHRWKRQIDRNADFIIVDEVQDFSREEILELQAAAGTALVLFGDSAQQVYKNLKRGLLTIEQIASHTGLNMESLVLNHRLRKKVARVVEHLNIDGDSLESRCQNEGADKPFLIRRDSFESELDFIMATIQERGYTDVGILFETNLEVETADTYFAKKDFNVEAKYDVDYPDRTKFSLNFRSENPKLLTYHSSKGLQFEAVFVPNCSTANPRGGKSPLYVALTRTYQDLFISHHRGLTPLLQTVPDTYFEKEAGSSGSQPSF